MVSVHTITLGFAPSRIWGQSMARYAAARNPDLVYKHWWVHNHYPVDKQRNEAENAMICRRYGVEWIDPGRNLGLHDGFNWALAQIKPQPEDIIIAYDPDSFVETPGFDMALVRAIRGDPERKAVWSSLMNPRSERDLLARGYRPRKADGYLDLWATKAAVTNSVCAFSAAWLAKVGGLTEPGPWYGHLEAAMHSQLGKSEWVFLPGWRESDKLRDLHDRAYVVYKWELSHTKTTQLDFESWLAGWDPVADTSHAPTKLP